MLKFIFSIVIILMMTTIEMYNAKEVDCKNFDPMFHEMTLVSSSKRRFPTNSAEFINHCKTNNELANKLTQLNKNCFNDAMRNIFALVIYSYKAETKSSCKNKNSQKTKNFIAAGPCLNQHRAKISKCIDTAALRIASAKSKPNKDRFPHLCCCRISKMYG
ncbi:hypothetical protein SSS_07825 [Sarcoptes scabiei]|nr:hypothetical protein SSS_07825 [Sarcoptes scabiei]